jgi:hypothetical protein
MFALQIVDHCIPLLSAIKETVDVIDEQLWILELRGVPGIWVDD